MPNHTFNIITFNWPKTKLKFWFSDTDIGTGHKIHRSLFPNNIEELFPEIFITYDGILKVLQRNHL
jgi:hypothetical protein